MKIIKLLIGVLIFVAIFLIVDYYMYQSNKSINDTNNNISLEIPKVIDNLQDNFEVKKIYDTLPKTLLLNTFFENKNINNTSLTNIIKLSIVGDYLDINGELNIPLTCKTYNTLENNNTLCLNKIEDDVVGDGYYYSTNNYYLLIQTAMQKYFNNNAFTNESFQINNNIKCQYIKDSENYICYKYPNENDCEIHPNISFNRARVFSDKIELYVNYMVDACNELYIDRVYYADKTLKNQIIPKKDISDLVFNHTEKYGLEYQMVFKKNNNNYYYYSTSIVK